MIKAIIFDCFGVLITDALSHMVGELKSRDPAAAERVHELIRASNRGLLDPNDSNTEIAAILGYSPDSYRQRIQDGEAKDERLLALVKQLRATYKTAILSNISATGLTKRFTAEELRECFDAVVPSAEIGYAKPDREAYLLTAERLGVAPEECLFTDDRVDFCAAAKDAGMQAIVYETFEQFSADLKHAVTGAK